MPLAAACSNVDEAVLSWSAPAKLVTFLKTLPASDVDVSKAGQIKLTSGGGGAECAATGCCLEAPATGVQPVFKPCCTEGYEDNMELQLFTVSFPYTSYIRRLPRGLLDTFTNKLPFPKGHPRENERRQLGVAGSDQYSLGAIVGGHNRTDSGTVNSSSDLRLRLPKAETAAATAVSFEAAPETEKHDPDNPHQQRRLLASSRSSKLHVSAPHCSSHHLPRANRINCANRTNRQSRWPKRMYKN